MKNSPKPLFLLHQTLQLAQCIGAGSIHQIQICLSDCQMVKCDSSLQRTLKERQAEWNGMMQNVGKM
jgi:hypothetical protein